MFSLRGLFPSFEKPVERPRYLNLEPARRDFRGIGTVLVLAASCGVALALWEPSTHATTPLVAASVQHPAPAAASKAASPAPAGVNKAAIQETTAAEDDDDQAAPTVKLSVFCSQRTTARRDCADVKALKDARLKTPEPKVPSKTDAAPAAAKVPDANQPEPASAPAKAAEPASVANAQPEAPAAHAPQRTATAPKAKRPRAADDARVERLVRVYDQILPDGRRVPVYRRAGGGYETGTIVDGEYRPTRRATLEPPYGARRFGLQ